MDISKKRKIRITITITLLLLFLVVNIYAVRRMTYYGIRLYFYDKMLVAYETGGMRGVNIELERVFSEDKMPREISLAKNFKNNLGNFGPVDEFLKGAVGEAKKKINLFRSMRNMGFVAILAIVLLRLMLNVFIKLDR